jgi:hypothetical protein
MESDPESKHIVVLRRGQFYYFEVSLVLDVSCYHLTDI